MDEVIVRIKGGSLQSAEQRMARGKCLALCTHLWNKIEQGFIEADGDRNCVLG